MSSWDIEEKESVDSPETAGRVGKQYYTIVVSYNDASIQHILPHHIKVDQKGRPMTSFYKPSEFVTQEGTQDTVKKEKVEKWSTKKDILEAMNSLSRGACNAMKAFLNKSEVALIYHNGVQDECSMFGGKIHWHIIMKSEPGNGRQWKYIHDQFTFRTMKVKVKAAQGYVNVQAVRSIMGLMFHLNKTPRVFMGTNSRELYEIWKESVNHAGPEDLRELVENENNSDDESKEKKEPFDSWEEKGPKQVTGSWNVLEDETSFVVPSSSQVAVVVKETATDKMLRLLRILMLRYKANNMSEMFHAIGSLPPGKDQSYASLWYRLCSKPAISKHMETCLNGLKAGALKLSFEERVRRYCSTPSNLDPRKYETPEASYKIFIKWCKKQKIDAVELITRTVDIMDNDGKKINCICLVGPSNSGKSQMFAIPLKEIVRYVGLIGNRGNDSAFLYQECVNCSLICIEECIMKSENYEDLKLLLGGEKMAVHVKHAGHASVQKTPVIMTGNKEPWVLDYSAKEAFLNRMYFYEVQVDDDLSQLKLPHPGMWWYLRQQYGQPQKLISFSKLEPYPQHTDEEMVEELFD